MAYTPSQEEAELDDAGARIDRDSEFNEGALLAQQLRVYQRAGLSTWGLVIYRCTYANDSDWQRFLDVLNSKVRQSLREYSHPELYQTLSWTIQSDSRTLDDASKDFVRGHFKDWVAREITGLQLDPENLTVQHFQKFRYCLHVDEEALKSVIDAAARSHSAGLRDAGYVNLIAKEWDEEAAKEDGEDEPEIDGKRTEDVGWMKVAVAGLAPRTYQLLDAGGDLYSDCYERPPAIAMP